MPIPYNYAAIAEILSDNIISACEATRRLNVAAKTFQKGIEAETINNGAY